MVCEVVEIYAEFGGCFLEYQYPGWFIVSGGANRNSKSRLKRR